MKKNIYLILPFFLIACGGDAEENVEESENEQIEILEEEEVVQNERKSPRTEYTSQADGLSLVIDYGSPSVKDRAIWGDLVDYDKVWRAGADEVTAITFENDVIVEGNAVLAGTYGFFIIPHTDTDWDIILNEEWSKEEHDVWGAYDYKEDKDVLRFTVAPISMSESVENLNYSFENGKLIFQWEFIRLDIEITAAESA